MALPEISSNDIDQVLEFATPVTRLAAQAEPVAGHPDLQIFLEAMDALDFTAVFDWQAEFQDRMDELESEAAIDQADLETLRMIMTAHVRIDRMTLGHLDKLISSGYWNRCIDRLRQLRATL